MRTIFRTTIILGGSSNLSLNPGSASILNRVYSRFLLERVARTRPEVQSLKISTEQRMQDALANLADIVGRPGMVDNDPLSSMSFSCLSEEEIQRQTNILRKYVLEKEPVFSPLGPDGRPLRKYDCPARMHMISLTLSFVCVRYSGHRSQHWFEDKRDESASVMGKLFRWVLFLFRFNRICQMLLPSPSVTPSRG